jgi:putative ABC transport system substrate-binding protein
LVLVGHVWAALGTAEFAYIVGLSLPVSLSATIDSAFGTLVELHAGALIVSTDPLFTNQRAQVAALAARHAVPAIYVWREFVAAGGLMSYGTDLADVHRQAGIYTGKILKGAKPADLPVEQVVKIELVINLTTAKAARTHNTAGAARPRRRSDRIMS